MENTSLASASSYLARYTPPKPSTPIEIPSVRRTITRRPPILRTPSTSIIGTTSPEQLIFHMSPEYTSTPTHIPFCYSPKLMMEREPFMYPFPTVSANDTQSEQSSGAHCPSSSPPDEVETIHTPASYRTRLTQPTAQRHTPYHRITAPAVAIRVTPVRKITGFKPVLPSQSSTSVSQAPTLSSTKERSGHLSPPPRRPSFSSSPWILPGRGDLLDGDVGSSEVAPVALDFEKYLMNRIEKFTKHTPFSRRQSNML